MNDLQLERLLLNEDEAGPHGAALEDQLRALRISNEEILNRYPAAGVAIEVHRRALRNAGSRRFRGPRYIAVATGALVVAASLVLVVERGPSERSKGTTALTVFRRADGRAQALRSGDFVRAGDLLRLRAAVSSPMYGMILSVDGVGQVTEHMPVVHLPVGRKDLEEAFELDTAPSFERFFFVTSDKPLNRSLVLQAVNRLTRLGAASAFADLELPSHVAQVSVLLTKESP